MARPLCSLSLSRERRKRRDSTQRRCRHASRASFGVAAQPPAKLGQVGAELGLLCSVAQP